MFTERKCLDLWNKLIEDSDELVMEKLLPLYAISVLSKWGSPGKGSNCSSVELRQQQ